MKKQEQDIIIRAVKTYALDRNSKADQSSFSNERELLMEERNEAVMLAKKLAERWDLPLCTAGEAFSKLL